MLALSDLQEKTEHEIIEHLIDEYSGSEGSYGQTDSDKAEARELLKNKEVLIAYESVGSWGCDSSSFFLLKDKETGSLFEVHGSHCSCYGFEGQLSLEETTVEVMKNRINGGGNLFYTGGYDDDSEDNYKKVNEYILNL